MVAITRGLAESSRSATHGNSSLIETQNDGETKIGEEQNAA